MEECEFCGRKVKRTKATSFVGAYCVQCHRLNRSESLVAIKQMQGKLIIKSIKVINQEKREAELNEVLDGLVGPAYKPELKKE